MLWATVNDVTILSSRRETAPQEQQPEHEQDVVGPIAMWWMPAGTNVRRTRGDARRPRCRRRAARGARS
jgi:hypothetical protein